MKAYKVVIKEIVQEAFEIEANSKDNAIREAIEKYNNCEIVLEPGWLISKELKVVNNDCKTDWIEF